MNCLGTLLLSYMEIENGTRKSTPVPHELGSLVQILDKGISANADKSQNWHIQYFIPFTIFRQYVGILLMYFYLLQMERGKKAGITKKKGILET